MSLDGFESFFEDEEKKDLDSVDIYLDHVFALLDTLEIVQLKLENEGDDFDFDIESDEGLDFDVDVDFSTLSQSEKLVFLDVLRQNLKNTSAKDVCGRVKLLTIIRELNVQLKPVDLEKFHKRYRNLEKRSSIGSEVTYLDVSEILSAVSKKFSSEEPLKKKSLAQKVLNLRQFILSNFFSK